MGVLFNSWWIELQREHTLRLMINGDSHPGGRRHQEPDQSLPG